VPGIPPEAMNAGLEQLVPRAHQMWVRFVELRPGYVRAELPLDGNTNHVGTVYAGVIFTLAEVLGGAMHVATFDVSTHYPIVRSMTIDFIAPGTTPLTAVAQLSDDEIAAIRAATATGKAPFVLVAEVTDANGTVVARTSGNYQLRPHGT
jgi:acyl-coenzyme A thioesterase PaaI-like protein